MSKILKELIIFILLTIVIVILLIIAFYEYMPKTMLSELERYSRTEQVSGVIQEINTSDITDGTKKDVVKSYSISATDLEAYKILDIYQDSKRPDPFSPLKYSAKYDTSIIGSSSEVIKNNSENKQNNKNNNSTGYFSTSSKTK